MTTATKPLDSETLFAYIGRVVNHAGESCEIIEILEQEPAITLRCRSGRQDIQADQFGDPSRKVPATRTIPIFRAGSAELNPEFAALGLPDPRLKP